MNNLTRFVAAGLVAGGLATTTWLVQAGNAEDNDAQAVKRANVTLYNALDIAQQHVPGTVSRAEFEQEDGLPVWEVEVLADNGQVYDLEIDARTGEVVKQSLDHEDRENDDHDGDHGD